MVLGSPGPTASPRAAPVASRSAGTGAGPSLSARSGHSPGVGGPAPVGHACRGTGPLTLQNPVWQSGRRARGLSSHTPGLGPAAVGHLLRGRDCARPLEATAAPVGAGRPAWDWLGASGSGDAFWCMVLPLPRLPRNEMAAPGSGPVPITPCPQYSVCQEIGDPAWHIPASRTFLELMPVQGLWAQVAQGQALGST